eukprot:10828560-Karenia_brevis.AAC.1
MLTQGEGAAPQSLRPIPITSCIYRLWAARRFKDVLAWQECWAPSCQHSYRHRHSVDDVFGKPALQVEHSVLTNTPLFGISFH